MSCENGKEGCANILQFFSDVIISDLNMPEMDGFTFLETVKRNPYTANIPFLVTSALVEADDIQKAFSLGATDYITKPFDFFEVQQKLKYYTRNRGKDRKKVLVVDDARIFRELLRAPMTAEGFRVFQAVNGKEGLEVAQRENVDLILSDYSMPEMDGWDFCRALKENEETEHIPVVMVTGKTSEMDRKIGRSLKVADYVTKPFTPEIIKNTVNMVFLEEMGRKVREEREIGSKFSLDSCTSTRWRLL